MQLKVLFGRKSHGRPGLLERKNNNNVVSFSALFFMFTLTLITEKELERVINKTKERNLVGRKTWKFKAAVKKGEMIAASKVKMSGGEK